MKPGFGSYSASLFRPQIKSIQKADPPDYANEIKRKFSAALRRSLEDDDKSSLALAYLVGEKGRLSEELSEQIRAIGLAHMVVASGFHLSAILNLAKKCFGHLSRALNLCVSLALIVAFVAVAGFSPSLARAGLISSLNLFASYVGRRFHPGRSLLFAATLSLLINPDYLVSLAWQLSFLAYGGIVLFAPVMLKYFYGPRRPGAIASAIIQSVAAQLLCLPLTIFYFGKLPLLALLANLLISPSIPLVMGLSFLQGVVFS